MLRYLTLISLLLLSANMAEASENLEQVLTQRCLDTFDFIEKKISPLLLLRCQ